MINAPECPEGCGPVVVPGHPEDCGRVGWVWCAACGHDYQNAEDYAQAVRAEDFYLAAEGVEESQAREIQTAAHEKELLADWEKWAVSSPFRRTDDGLGYSGGPMTSPRRRAS